MFSFSLGADVGLLGDLQIFWLVAASNEFTTSRAIGEHSRRYSVNRTALKSRLGRLQWHDGGCFADCTPRWLNLIEPGMKFYAKAKSASVESHPSQWARRMGQEVLMPR